MINWLAGFVVAVGDETDLRVDLLEKEIMGAFRDSAQFLLAGDLYEQIIALVRDGEQEVGEFVFAGVGIEGRGIDRDFRARLGHPHAFLFDQGRYPRSLGPVDPFGLEARFVTADGQEQAGRGTGAVSGKCDFAVHAFLEEHSVGSWEKLDLWRGAGIDEQTIAFAGDVQELVGCLRRVELIGTDIAVDELGVDRDLARTLVVGRRCDGDRGGQDQRHQVQHDGGGGPPADPREGDPGDHPLDAMADGARSRHRCPAGTRPARLATSSRISA
jgi:hypothetical protein